MKKKILLLVMTLLIGGCSNLSTNSASNDSSNPSVPPSVEPSLTPSVESSASESSLITSDGTYQWGFEDNSFYSTKYENLGVEVNKNNSNLAIKLAEQTIFPKSNTPTDILKVRYDAIGANSENANNASDTVYINFLDPRYTGIPSENGRFPADGAKGFDIPIQYMNDNELVISIIIGGYWGDGIYDFSRPHGNAYQSSGKDDFRIGNMHLITPANNVVYPSNMVFYKPKEVGKKGYNLVNVPFEKDKMYWIGDGWSGNDTYDGNPDPRLDIPVQIDFYFSYDTPEKISYFDLDFSNVAEGEQIIQLLDNNVVVHESKIIIDNTAPLINVNIKDLEKVSDLDFIKFDFTETGSGIDSFNYSLDNLNNFTNKGLALTTLEKGMHSIYVFCKDKAGNAAHKYVTFIIDKTQTFKNTEIEITANNVSITPRMLTSEATASLYKIDELDYSVSTTNKSYPLTESSNSNIPYIDYEVNVTDSNDILVNLNAETIAYETYLIKALNPSTNSYDTLYRATNKENVNLKVSNQTYARNNKINLRITPNYVENGSNTMMWITDTQHYTKFEDLNFIYTEMMQHAADKYVAGEIGYLLHTGDLVDDIPSVEESTKQWLLADTAHKIVDDVNLPNGVVSGNHDVGTAIDSMDYNVYEKYFATNRYSDSLWYGGDLNNNQSHFDLITIGNIDFIVIYLAYGYEATEDTVRWANDILKRYSHRNAIIATHSYLNPYSSSSQYTENATGYWDPTSRAEEIYNEIIVPNENVKIVLCGHATGAALVKREVNENRFLYEILSDYQFVENSRWDNPHYIGSVGKCNGEGYLRTMTFNGNEIFTTTYSPIEHVTAKNPFGTRDEFTITVDFTSSTRHITINSFNVYSIKDQIGANVDLSRNKPVSLSLENNNQVLVVLKDNRDNETYHLLSK